MQQRWFAYSGLLSLLALAIALLSQHVFGLRPCAWCVFQRLLLIFIVLGSLVGYAALLYKKRVLALVARLLIIITAIGGIAAAWYQYTVAAKLFSCDMTLADRVMTQSGLESTLPWLFGIYASCMDAAVSLLGLDYAIWGLLLFSVIALTHLWQGRKN